jgi:hypothetical protein
MDSAMSMSWLLRDGRYIDENKWRAGFVRPCDSDEHGLEVWIVFLDFDNNATTIQHGFDLPFPRSAGKYGHNYHAPWPSRFEVRAVPGEDFRGVLHYPEGPMYHHNYTPNSSVPDEVRSGYCVSVPGAPCDDSLFQAYDNRQLTMTARSAHPGGVHLLLGDGSATFISDSIELNLWQAICTPRAIPGEMVFGGF